MIFNIGYCCVKQGKNESVLFFLYESESTNIALVFLHYSLQCIVTNIPSMRSGAKVMSTISHMQWEKTWSNSKDWRCPHLKDESHLRVVSFHLLFIQSNFHKLLTVSVISIKAKIALI